MMKPHACLLAGLLMAMLAPPLVAAPSEDCPVVSLSCTAVTSLDRALCRGLQRALTESLPNYVVRQVDDLSQTPVHAQDIAVSLQVLGQGETYVLARLDWCHGPCSELHQGDPLRLNVMDARLSSEMLQMFARTMLQSNPQLLPVAPKTQSCFNQ